MSALRIPARPSEITAEWLTRALRSTRTVTNSKVRSLIVEPLTAGQGFMSQLARIKVTYDRHEAGAPVSLFCKMHSADESIFGYAKYSGTYVREVGFYEDLAESIPVRIPDRYYSNLDNESGAFVLLLEDLEGARPGNQVDGCTVEEASLVVRQAAMFHSRFWNSHRLRQYGWLQPWSVIADRLQQSYPGSYESFSGKWGALIPPQIATICERVMPHVGRIKQMVCEGPQVVIHGDFRIDNMLFGTPESVFPIALVDWQGCRIARGECDIAYFLSGSLVPEMRRVHERDLLQIYCSALHEYGVSGYDFEQCQYAYKLALLDRISFYVNILPRLDFSDERGRRLVETMLSRFFSSLIDNNVEELLMQI